MFKVNKKDSINKKDSNTTSPYIFPLSLFIFKHMAHLALEFLLLSFYC